MKTNTNAFLRQYRTGARAITLIMLLVAMATSPVGCGGSGGQSSGAPPSISNLSMAPSGAYVNSSNGTALVNGQLTFAAPASALASVTITVLSASGATLDSGTAPVQGAGAGSSGTLTAMGSLSTATAGPLTLQVYVTDAAGKRSNTLSATFKVNNFPWTETAAMQSPRVNAAAVALGSQFYVLGGESAVSPVSPAPPVNTVEIFDAASQGWSPANPLPQTVDFPVAAAVDGVIYVVGGRSATAPCSQIGNVYALDPATGAWTTKAAIPHPVFGASAAIVGTKIYVVGGAQPGVCPDVSTSAVNVYDTADDTWTALAPMPFAAAFLGSGVVNGRIAAFGGATVTGASITSGVSAMAEYDPATNAWTSGASPGSVIDGASATVGGTIYAFGGVSGIGPASTYNSAYDVATAQWHLREALPANSVVLGPVADAYNGRIYAFSATTTWVYNPDDDLN